MNKIELKDNRIHYIDILKGIGIIFVILGHLQSYIPKSLLIYIYSFHMPLFFWISGFLYKEKYETMSTKSYLIKKSKELLYPYFTLCLINFIWYVLKEHSIKIVIKCFLSFLYSNLIFEENFIGPVWFLLCLFIVEIVFFMFKKNKNVNINISTLICFFIGILDIKFLNIRLPFWIDIAFWGIIFYIAGYIYKRKYNTVKINVKKNIGYIFFYIVCNIIGIILNYKYNDNSKFMGRIDMLYLNLGNPLLFIITAIFGILTWVEIAKLIKENNILELFGKNTLCIMGIHILYIQIMMKVLRILNCNIIVISGSLIFIVTAICSLLTSIIINQYFSWMIKIERKENKI